MKDDAGRLTWTQLHVPRLLTANALVITVAMMIVLFGTLALLSRCCWFACLLPSGWRARSKINSTPSRSPQDRMRPL